MSVRVVLGEGAMGEALFKLPEYMHLEETLTIPVKMVGALAAGTLQDVDDILFLKTVDRLMEVMYTVARKADLTVVGVASHQFMPEGATGVLLLAESHFCVHTW